MDHLNVYYRALQQYRRLTIANRECALFAKEFAESNAESDALSVTLFHCDVDTDWIEAIEAGLIPIEKAIAQERQFIRSNGEIVPIEKVKHVSKETVEHLARHSDLITRYREGEPLLPDALYTVERDTDYAVYENRVLYLILTLLLDFITPRYDAILQLIHRYEAALKLEKEIRHGKRSISYSLSLHDVSNDDACLRARSRGNAVLERIDAIQKMVNHLIDTPLMQAVSHSPLVRAPITKTNVLKMNHDFRGAMELYDFITTYDKPGYTVNREDLSLAPFKKILADEMAEVGTLATFVTYCHALTLSPELKEACRKEDEAAAVTAARRRSEHIASLKKSLDYSGETMEEYISLLETQLHALENEAARADALEARVRELTDERDRLKDELLPLSERVVFLEATIDAERIRHDREMEEQRLDYERQLREQEERHTAELTALREAHAAELAALREAHAAELAALREAHAAELAALREAHAAEIAALHEAHREEIATLTAEHEAEITALHESHAAEIDGIKEAHAREEAELRRAHADEIDVLKRAHSNELERRDRALAAERANAEQTIAAMTARYDADIADRTAERDHLKTQLESTGAELTAAQEQCRLMALAKEASDARIRALGGIEHDCLDRDSFEELEQQYRAFRQLYRDQWRKVKRAIRDRLLNRDSLKNTKKDDGEDDGSV